MFPSNWLVESVSDRLRFLVFNSHPCVRLTSLPVSVFVVVVGLLGFISLVTRLFRGESFFSSGGFTFCNGGRSLVSLLRVDSSFKLFLVKK